jgi:hypothetical protein
MTGLFALHLLQAEETFVNCRDCPGCKHFCVYPKYTTLQVQEGLDLNWIGTRLAYSLGSYPASIDGDLERQSSLSDYAVTLCSVAAVWFLGCVWIQRLRRGQRLASNRNAVSFFFAALAVVCTALSVVLMFQAADAETERTPLTMAAAIPTLVIAIAAITEAGYASLLNRRAIVMSLALLLAGFYGWFVNSVQLERVRYELPDSLPFDISDMLGPTLNAAETGLAVHFPLFVVMETAALALPALASPHWLAVQIGAAFLYWYAILAAVMRRQKKTPASSPWRTAILMILRVQFLFLAVAGFCLWNLPDHHGTSVPFLMGAIGAYAVSRAFRQTLEKDRGAFIPRIQA